MPPLSLVKSSFGFIGPVTVCVCALSWQTTQSSYSLKEATCRGQTVTSRWSKAHLVFQDSSFYQRCSSCIRLSVSPAKMGENSFGFFIIIIIITDLIWFFFLYHYTSMVTPLDLTATKGDWPMCVYVWLYRFKFKINTWIIHRLC